ncbi:MAG: hypothetical protein II659_08970 [Bacteroidales bacterium]|nr:hypothetical protein [Bacteroidales bacterium]
MNYGLPKSLEVNGREEPIRWEYTAILDAISALNDPDLEKNERLYDALFIIYENFEYFKPEDLQSAWDAAYEFINGDVGDDSRSDVKTIDFEQDYKIMIPAINKVAGREIRGEEGIHWWTFIGWLMELGDCTYSTVLTIRTKQNKGKKLESYERDFYNANKNIVDIKPRLSKEEKEQEEWLNNFLR